MRNDLTTREGFDRELERRRKLQPDTDPAVLHDILMSVAKPAILKRIAA